MSEKRDIILSEGSPVELIKTDGTIVPTIALLGRSTRQSSTMATLQAHRRAHFTPDIAAENGEIIHDLVTGDRFIIAAAYREHFEGEVIGLITHVLLCNTKLTITGLQETVSTRGDIKKVETVKAADMDVHTQATTVEMRQQNPGIFVDAEYVIYSPATDVLTLDKLTMMVGARKIPLKVVHADYVSYPGLVLIQACTETRK